MTLVERLLTAEPSAATSRPLESRGSLTTTEDEAPAAAHRGRPRPGPHFEPSSSEGKPRRARLVESVWFPVVSKASVTLLILLGLAGIGAYAARRGPAGHRVALPDHGTTHSPWIATQAGALPAPSAAGSQPPASASASAGSSGAGDTAPSGALLADGRVVLNLATASDLRRLPGVGQKRAEAILALRAKLGGKFRRFTDLLRVRGIGPKRLQQMLPKMVLDPPADAAKAAPSASSDGKGP